MGRPLDPAWPTNRALLALMPVGALGAAVIAPALPGLADTSRLWAAVLGGAVVLGAWALGRETAPDDQRAAFLALAGGYVALLAVPGASLSLLFATLMVTRMVARTVGPPPRVLDAIAVLALIGWAIASTRSYGVGLVGAAAFALDGALPGGERRQWGFAALCLALVGFLAPWAGAGPAQVGQVTSTPVSLGLPGPVVLAATGLVTALFALAIGRTRTLRSVGDATGEPLLPVRVRWAMALALTMAIQTIALGDAGVRAGALVWAALGGVGLSAALGGPGWRGSDDG